MSDNDRGPYTPPNDRLAFDPRQPVRSGPAPVTLIASALVLLAIVGGVVFVYRHGFRHAGPPAVVGAPVAQMKTAAPLDANAAAPSGLQVEKTNAVSFAPPPEQPGARPTVTELPPPATPAAAPKPAPIASLPPAQSAAANSVAPLRPAKPLTIASIADAAVAGGVRPAKPAAQAVAAASPAKLAAAKPAKPAAQAAPAAATVVNPAPGVGWIQIGAYSSAALADKGWEDVAHLAPDQMAGKGKRVQQVSVNGKTFYRAYVTGFYSSAAAGAFCDDLKSAGHACIVR
ncbi:MAG TPA: SPOR domain-containing protein [Caulobacteraceae bacterium]|jgi:hypothetical protein